MKLSNKLGVVKTTGTLAILAGMFALTVAIGSPGSADGGNAYPYTSTSSSTGTSQTPSRTPSASASGSKAPSLPVTGSKTTWLLIGGGLLLVVGVAGVLVARRKRDVEFTV